jgi:hypothetical protein
VILFDQRAVCRIGAGVVDQDVDAAEVVECQVNAAFGGIFFDRMGADAQGLLTDLRRGRTAASCLREVTTTFAPASASCCAIAKPMPRDAPVIIAVRPVRSNDISAHLRDLDRGGLVSVLA